MLRSFIVDGESGASGECNRQRAAKRGQQQSDDVRGCHGHWAPTQYRGGPVSCRFAVIVTCGFPLDRAMPPCV